MSKYQKSYKNTIYYQQNNNVLFRFTDSIYRKHQYTQ